MTLLEFGAEPAIFDCSKGGVCGCIELSMALDSPGSSLGVPALDDEGASTLSDSPLKPLFMRWRFLDDLSVSSKGFGLPAEPGSEEVARSGDASTESMSI